MLLHECISLFPVVFLQYLLQFEMNEVDVWYSHHLYRQKKNAYKFLLHEYSFLDFLRTALLWNFHGPGNKGNLNLLYGVVSKGIPWPLGAFENKRSFTSIGNLQVVIMGLLTKDVPSGIYHMGDDEALSTNELIEVICSALGKKAHIWNIPRGLMNGVAKLGDVLHLPLNSLRMQKLTENYVVSNAKIKAALGMKEMPVRAKDGLRETIKSFVG